MSVDISPIEESAFEWADRRTTRLIGKATIAGLAVAIIIGLLKEARFGLFFGWLTFAIITGQAVSDLNKEIARLWLENHQD